nr:MAG TPA: hypothetical protein [Caudoviricetes sp.]
MDHLLPISACSTYFVHSCSTMSPLSLIVL